MSVGGYGFVNVKKGAGILPEPFYTHVRACGTFYSFVHITTPGVKAGAGIAETVPWKIAQVWFDANAA